MTSINRFALLEVIDHENNFSYFVDLPGIDGGGSVEPPDQ